MRGYPSPGRVSTLLNHTYSTPVRFVHACLHVTEHVWHPMHLSRFMTIDICAITRTTPPLPAGRPEAACCVRPRHEYRTSWLRRRTTVISSRWFPVGPR